MNTNKDHDQCDAPTGTDPSIRYDDNGREWFNYGGSWYQAGASMPATIKQAWLAEHMRRDREEKQRRY